MNFSLKRIAIYPTLFCLVSFVNCTQENKRTVANNISFYFGADLSYVNQILDHNGVYKDQGEVRSPYRIFKDHGANLVRLRLWHNPAWTKEIYGNSGTQLYNDLKDVEKSIQLSKDQGLQVLLNFHFSDSWADPDEQRIPKAWKAITDSNVLKDSVYRYTFKVLSYLNSKELMPEFVQIGNEINCGMLYTDAPVGFPSCNNCDGNWNALGQVINNAIIAVKEVSTSSSVKTKIILHVADPKNVEWWFDHMITDGKVTQFDIIGFSYYPIWHTTVQPDQLSESVSKFATKYKKDVMILETGYPWTTEGKDSYHNIFGSQDPTNGYPYTQQGQHDMLIKITQEVIDGGGKAVIYWEPAWISSGMKDLWGTGSSWENVTLFDFEGNTLPSMDYMNYMYEKK